MNNQDTDIKSNDHKKLGRELDLFTFSGTVGKGLPLWTPKGAAIRRTLERWVVDEEIKDGYLHVYTPDIANLNLYKKSGHYPYYKASMYAPIVIDDEEYMLRPMTCPHHFELYLSSPHSYKELPLRYAELAKLYRYEQSGELMGLQRVRTFCLSDAHIITRQDQAKSEIIRVLNLIEKLTSTLGLKPNINEGDKGDYYYRLSLGNRHDSKKYFKDDASWDFAEKILNEVLMRWKKDHPVRIDVKQDEAAFYGPKIDIQMWNANGKEDTAFTVQYDFVMPKRFHLTYINEQGKEEQPVVIHRSSIGAIERLIAFLIEKYNGKFPLWLSPIQVMIIPIAEKHAASARRLQEVLMQSGIRASLDERKERMQAKVRDGSLQKIPFLAIIGDKELNHRSVAVRSREGNELETLTETEFLEKLKTEIETKR